VISTPSSLLLPPIFHLSARRIETSSTDSPSSDRKIATAIWSDRPAVPCAIWRSSRARADASRTPA
jgi:hypothetical protein